MLQEAGSTRACAGNTESASILSHHVLAHPRLRGKYLEASKIFDGEEGPPALARDLSGYALHSFRHEDPPAHTRELSDDLYPSRTLLENLSEGYRDIPDELCSSSADILS